MRTLTRPLLLTLLLAPAALAGRLPGDPGDSLDIRDWIKDDKNPNAGGDDIGGDDIGAAVKTMATAMAGIAKDLSKQDTSAPVQTKQKEVASSLDSLIANLEQQCNGGGGGGNMNPTQGLKKSILAGGPGGVGDLRDARAGEKQWGALKPKDRDQILQAKTDGFPAGYESLLQSYYRRLASEDNAQPAAPAPATPANPSGAERQ
ncbi:MAG: hypothetical protein QM754_09570 [Tepidisphaeraceae bacterium]